MAKPYFIVYIYNAEDDEEIGMIEASSMESLEEQLHKVPTMVENYEAKQKELEQDELLSEE